MRKKVSKLTINKETLRQLNPSGLKEAQGARWNTDEMSYCVLCLEEFTQGCSHWTCAC